MRQSGANPRRRKTTGTDAATRRPRRQENGWERVIGKAPDAFAGAYWHARPDWVRGTSISYGDAKFLFRKALEANAKVAVEIGTASGFSTGLLCHALAFASDANKSGANYRIVTYDIATEFFADRSHRSGDAAREQLPSKLIERVVFRAPATVADLVKDFAQDEIQFLFIDANHRHPWPTLDLLGALDYVASGATVVFHDINLPVIHPEYPDWGAKHLFDSLSVEKETAQDGEDNIGAIRVPAERDALREQLLGILYNNPWDVEVPVEFTTAALS